MTNLCKIKTRGISRLRNVYDLTNRIILEIHKNKTLFCNTYNILIQNRQIEIMRKFLLIIICALASTTLALAQNTFSGGDKVINIGIGFGSTLHTGTGYSTKIPPITGSFEMCVVDQLFDDKSSLGVGGYIGYGSSEYKYNFGGISDFKYKYSDFIIGARGSLHYQFVDKLDTYAGLALGYDIVSGSTSGTYTDYSASASGLDFGVFLGARYYFSENLAGMTELGYDIAVFKLGIAYKF